MATLTLRIQKGAPLTNAEVDANFSNINNELANVAGTLLPLKADISSPALTGVPTAPTAAVNTNTTQLATTAFVLGQAANTNPLVNGTVAIGTSKRFAKADHVHPTDTTRAPLASPALTGTPTAPTATLGTNTTQLSTTAFVMNQITFAEQTLVPRTSSTGSAVIPSGTSAQRDGSPQDGFIRYNTELQQFEGYFNGVWQSVGGGQLLGNAVTKGIFYNANTISENLTVLAGTNGMSAGPITIADGFTVTIPEGATWTVV